jgi:ribonuclease J
VREAEALMDEVRTIAYDTLRSCLDKNMKEWNAIKAKVKDELTDYLYAKTKRKPMILPVFMNI